MNATSKIKMDLTNPDVTLTVNAVQGDTYTRSLKIALYNGIIPWPIPAGITAAVRYAKPDQTKGYYDTMYDGTPAWSVKDNILTVHLAPQMLTVPGNVKMQVELNLGTSTLSTFTLNVYVEPNPAAGVLKSEDYVNWLQWIFDQAQSHTHSVQQAAIEAQQAAQTAAASTSTALEVTQRAEVAASESKTSAMSAETAKSDTEKIAAHVQAIVAGNEAYTKQESDLRYGSAIVQTVSGEITVIVDSAQMPLVGLKLFGKTTQVGTPSPDVPVELTSVGHCGAIDVIVCGKNMLGITTAPGDTMKSGIAFRINEDNSFDISGTATANVSFAFGWNGDGSHIADILKQGGRFVFFCDKAMYDGKTFNCSIAYRYDGATKYVSADGKPVDVPAGAEYINTTVYVPAGSTVVTVESGHLQLEFSNAATAYEPYTEQIVTLQTPGGLPGIPVSTGGNWIDEDGQQWICDEVDFNRGVYIHRIGTVAYKDMNMATWLDKGYYYENPDAIKNVGTVFRAAPNTHFATSAMNPDLLPSDHITLSGSTVYFRVSNTTYPTAEDFTAFLNQLEGYVMYELAEYTEVALSAEMLAQYAALQAWYPRTNILNDAKAGMEVKYLADTKQYIDHKLAALKL